MAGRAKIVLQAAAVSVVALLLGLFAWRVATKEEAASIRAALAAGGSPAAPDFELPLLSRDGTLRLSSLRGEVVVVNFWASWCIPCKEEAPVLERGWQRWRDRGVVFLGVDAQDFKSDARRFLKRHEITYPSVYDEHGSTLGRWGVTGFPETFFVNGDGKLVAHHQGPLTAEELDGNVERALEP